MVTQASAAPGDLELVRAFVNTIDLEDGEEQLGSPAELAAWLRHRGLVGGGSATSAQLVAAIRLREALRTLLLANTGVSVRKEATATLDRIARSLRLTVTFGSAGARVEGARGGVDGALARLLGIAAEAMLAGTWQRLKVCRAETCRWAFYDHARNHSREWCSMAVCGNRRKARAYRRRRARA